MNWNPKPLDPADVTVHRRGRGKPLILLHCLGMDWRFWDVLEPLTDQFELIAYSLPGHHDTKVPKGQYGEAELSEQLRALMKREGIAKASLADITSGKFIGTTTVGERNGSLVAEEVHIFPESMRGTGEGHRDWDLRPQSKMTNANVAEIKNMGDGKVLTIKYKGGEKQVLVTPRTSVVSFEPASRSDLKPGAGVFVNNAERLPFPTSVTVKNS